MVGGGSADRAKEPVTYWLTLVIQYLGGVLQIWVGSAKFLESLMI